ncbi:NAD-dependent epimerase/dehydratase [Sinomonas atrocyanea]|uniref:NAD-dependent epimerase/dehydratase n=1 Tax=Sinomonas atrocyanea TaxID=37927 RepID=A0A127A4T4_9MICC|nr:NAD(P)-dependent oxidoreductase [Sinomonas atrocyanea]AMM34449.1 NAD-dependent epimerase/dehydratase [Sinomonas atrocyanea]GEB65827.1 UDP-glucose 4-epimerase [Sinomonas atrocyanea]GGG61145.1 UDP-glucose 4-epimerase [Sinomonas atrocyanea]
MPPKKVVVTGGSGRVGRYVLENLAEIFQVRNADLAPALTGAGGRPPAEAEFVKTDVLDLDDVRAALAGADAVVHLAAIDFDWKAPAEDYIRVNTLGTWNVLQAAEENGLDRAVLCSSVSACGLSEMRPDWAPQYLQVDEEHELRPVQAYSLSKQIMETMGQAVARGSHMSVVALRPLAVVLPETLAEFTGFVDDPELRWLYYYIEASDLARAFRAALESEVDGFDAFFISADDTCHPEPTLAWYPRVAGEETPPHDPAVFTANPRASVFSSARAKERLGWSPTSNFLEMRAAAGLPLPDPTPAN